MNEESSNSYAVSIGNSDDKLSQREWVMFCIHLEDAVKAYAREVFFVGYTGPDSSYQSFTITFSATPRSRNDLWHELSSLCSRYHQDSIAVIEGQSWFISPRPVVNAVRRSTGPFWVDSEHLQLDKDLTK